MTGKPNPIGQSLVNRCIVLHLRASGPCSFNDLLVLFGCDEGIEFDVAKVRFSSRITYLLSIGRIVVSTGGNRGNRVYAAAPDKPDPEPMPTVAPNPKPPPTPR